MFFINVPNNVLGLSFFFGLKTAFRCCKVSTLDSAACQRGIVMANFNSSLIESRRHVLGGEASMGNKGRGTIFRIKGSKYLLYLPVRVVDDSMFPFKCDKSMLVRVSFKPGGDHLIVEKWTETENL
jgi:hypothetical protein